MRVSGALGVSVALHVLGAGLLWGGGALEREPERLEPGGPLEVELVWREASAPPPGRVAESAARPVSPPRRRKVGTPRPQVPAPAPAPAGTPSEPEHAVRQAVPGSEEGETADAEAPGEGVAGTTGPEGAVSSGAQGTPGGTGAGGDPALLLYREQLRQSVARRLRYPAQAVRLGLVGTALVRVRINRDGSLGAVPRLEGSSRFRVLDVEALRTVEAAAPFSPLPREEPRESVEFLIPVSFSLRVGPG